MGGAGRRKCGARIANQISSISNMPSHPECQISSIFNIPSCPECQISSIFNMPSHPQCPRGPAVSPATIYRQRPRGVCHSHNKLRLVWGLFVCGNHCGCGRLHVWCGPVRPVARSNCLVWPTPQTSKDHAAARLALRDEKAAHAEAEGVLQSGQ